MQSDVIAGVLDSSFENVTYSLIIEDLQPLTMYYYRVVATNIAGVTVSGVENFTTRKPSMYICISMPCVHLYPLQQL